MQVNLTSKAKRLIVIFTGGTIGSRKQNSAIDVDAGGTYALMEAYRESGFNREQVELQSLQPLNMLSENITPQDWHELAASLERIDQTRYDGIIVTHGSDTLAYSAVLLGYLFAAATIPIVLTASNYPLEDERSNGLRNFANAIDFASGEALPGVFVVYENEAGRSMVYLSTRLTQAEAFTDQFGSPYHTIFGEMKAGRFEAMKSAYNPSIALMRKPAQARLRWTPDTLRLEDRILYIKPYPGLNYSLYRLDAGGKPRAVLHDLHHSGTACAIAEGPYSLPAFIRACKKEGIPVFICPVKSSSEAQYASTRSVLEAGAVLLEGISMEAALVKLMLAFGVHNDAAAEALATGPSLFYERMEAYPD